MKETEVLRLSRRWNLEKWKCCICILICPQSGTVFGVAAKLPGVCSSSLFIGAPWETGLKFKSACYHSVWRWGFLNFFLCLFRSFHIIHSLHICLSPAFFIFHHSTSVLYYFSWLFSYTLFFFCIVFFFVTLSTFLPHPAPPISHCHESECTDFISDAMCHATLLWSAPAVMESWPRSALIISTLCHTIPLPRNPPLCSPLLYIPPSLHPSFPL